MALEIGGSWLLKEEESVLLDSASIGKTLCIFCDYCLRNQVPLGRLDLAVHPDVSAPLISSKNKAYSQGQALSRSGFTSAISMLFVYLLLVAGARTAHGTAPSATPVRCVRAYLYVFIVMVFTRSVESYKVGRVYCTNTNIFVHTAAYSTVQRLISPCQVTHRYTVHTIKT